MQRTVFWRTLGAFWLAFFCAACGSEPVAAPTATAPSPTIAAAVIPPTPVLSPTPPRQPTAAPAAPTSPAPAQPAAGSPAPEQTIYLWPSELPAGMQPDPAESRVSRENELGEGDLGFYLITLNGGGKKLVIGGGGLSAALPLSGEKRAVTAGTRTGTLITNGEQREIVFDVARGLLFVYSLGLSEDELLRVAASLQPADVNTLRALAAPK
jgi:hypothetical protein